MCAFSIVIGQWVDQVLACVLATFLLANGLNKCLHVNQLRDMVIHASSTCPLLQMSQRLFSVGVPTNRSVSILSGRVPQWTCASINHCS